jgi:hypothetical protein
VGTDAWRNINWLQDLTLMKVAQEHSWVARMLTPSPE